GKPLRCADELPRHTSRPPARAPLGRAEVVSVWRSWWARAGYQSRSRLVKAAALPQHGRKALRIHPPATRAAGRPAPSASLVLDLDAGDSVRLRVRHRARGRHDLARGAAQTIPADVDRMGKLVGLHARTVPGLAKEA